VTGGSTETIEAAMQLITKALEGLTKTPQPA
jgi:hypothetical protein